MAQCSRVNTCRCVTLRNRAYRLPLTSCQHDGYPRILPRGVTMAGTQRHWFMSGKGIPDGVVGLFKAPGMAAALAFLAFLLGLCGSLFSDAIRTATRRAFVLDGGSLDWGVTVFWLLAMLWGTSFYVRLIVEASEGERFQRLIQRCPNPKVLPEYGELVNQIAQDLVGALETPDDDDGFQQLERMIKSSLAKVLALASRFAGHSPSAPAGCNVMLIVEPSMRPASVKLHFFPPAFDQALLRYVLHMPTGLIVSNQNSAHVVSIALPVPREIYDTNGTRRCLPGAPFALLSGQLSVHNDTRRLASEPEIGGLDGEVIAELTKYFSPSGDGKYVRSFASVRIGDQQNPVAVLNLDYSEPNILGSEPEYYGTFLALLAPVLLLIGPSIKKYATLGTKLGRFA